jgi:hypothetical protein
MKTNHNTQIKTYNTRFILILGMFFFSFLFFQSAQTALGQAFTYGPAMAAGGAYGSGSVSGNYFKGQTTVAACVNFTPYQNVCYASANGSAYSQVPYGAGYGGCSPGGCYATAAWGGTLSSLTFAAYYNGSGGYVVSPAVTFIYDVTGPSVSANNSSGSWYSSQRSATMAASDGGAGLSSLTIGVNIGAACNMGYSVGGTFYFNAGANYLYMCASDNLGNVSYWSGTYYWENTAPSVSATNNNGTWYNYQRSAVVSASDSGGSGLSSICYSWGSTACGTGVGNGATLYPPAGGAALYLRAADGAGNTGAWGYGYYYWENTAPTCGTWSPNPSTWRITGAQTFTLSGSTDTGGSGISTAGGNCTTANTNGATCTVGISDVAGNTRTCTSPINRIESTPPTCGTWAPTSSPWKTSGTQAFTLSGSTDTGGSGISTAGGNCTTGAANGNTCTVGISDIAGNTTTCTSPVNNVDPTPPSVSANNNSSTWFNYQRTATVSASDTGGSTLAEVRYNFGSNPMNAACTTGGTVTTNGSVLNSSVGGTTLYLCARDGAGNVTTWNGVYNWENTAPIVSATST